MLMVYRYAFRFISNKAKLRKTRDLRRTGELSSMKRCPFNLAKITKHSYGKEIMPCFAFSLLFVIQRHNMHPVHRMLLFHSTLACSCTAYQSA